VGEQQQKEDELMLTIYAMDVDDAYSKAWTTMQIHGEKSESRNGPVTAVPCPVTTVYVAPMDRVLFNEVRDANPFFHLFESLWMLSGSDDATWLDRFVGDFSSRYAEEDGTQWGAYGHRWRVHFEYDQLDVVVRRLKRDPNDRRVVIQMWDANADLFDPEMGSAEPKDVPCNTQIYPRIVNGRLDITVTCRSNDVVWGAYGANAVHFSVLLEYLAGRIGVRVGKMYQISNNWHLYDAVASRFQPVQYRPYPGSVPMATDWDGWDDDLTTFMDGAESPLSYRNAWFSSVAEPMWAAHSLWKVGDRIGAQLEATRIDAPDWRIAALKWMDRRMQT
jgi:thymidylate synthase